MITLPDERADAAKILGTILPDRGIVICTGGLGGTEDDVTRSIFSSVFGRKLIVDRKGEEHLRGWYASRGRTFEEPDRMQASHPEGGMLLPNHVGLAFGFYVHDGERYVYALPGVPGEMKRMFQTSVAPHIEGEGLLERFGAGDYHYEMLNFIDISEYTLDRIVHEIVNHHRGVQYGTRSSDGVVRVRLESRVDVLDECIREITSLSALQDNYLCRGEKNLEEVVGELFTSKRYTLSVAESCTGGLLAKLLTDVPGSSCYFMGGVVSYSNEAKERLLGVSHEALVRFGAVSERVATEMALGAVHRFSSDVALSITGVAGPEGGSPEKPVGTVFLCLASREGTVQVEKNRYLGDRETVRLRSANKALSMLFNHVAHRNGQNTHDKGDET
jgi:nicotinamide-nucleotide amidase